MIPKEKIIGELLKRLATLQVSEEESLAQHKEAAIKAPGAMQSASDMTKYQENILADETLARLDKVKRAYSALEETRALVCNDVRSGAVAAVQEKGGIVYWCFVPEGAGGQNFLVDGVTVQTISVESPLGKTLSGKKAGAFAELKVPAGVRRLKVLTVT